MCCLPCIIRCGSCLRVPRYTESTTKQSEQTVAFLTHTQMLAASYVTPENNIVVVKYVLQCVAASSFCSLARILKRIYFTREISIPRPVIHLKFGFSTRSLSIASRCNLQDIPIGFIYFLTPNCQCNQADKMCEYNFFFFCAERSYKTSIWKMDEI